MKMIFFLLTTVLFATHSIAQKPVELTQSNTIVPLNVTTENTTFNGIGCLKVMDTGENSELKMAKLPDIIFKDGVIEVDVAGMPMAGSSEQARGFVGIAFRIKPDNSAFECFYLRPTNGRADDQVRRNHSSQYISYPDYPWHRSRKETPEKYESYVDLVPGEWTKIKIIIEGDKARLFVHDNQQPTLIVNDLKHGADATGAVGLWIGPGTEAYFSNLRITSK
jgi:hypothetical protein